MRLSKLKEVWCMLQSYSRKSCDRHLWLYAMIDEKRVRWPSLGSAPASSKKQIGDRVGWKMDSSITSPTEKQNHCLRSYKQKSSIHSSQERLREFAHQPANGVNPRVTVVDWTHCQRVGYKHRRTLACSYWLYNSGRLPGNLTTRLWRIIGVERSQRCGTCRLRIGELWQNKIVRVIVKHRYFST